MATGFIGTSTVTSSAVAATGPTLSYACPASGVRYAVVTITAIVWMTYVNTPVGRQCRAGALTYEPVFDVTNGAGQGREFIYTVILGPNQSWSDNTHTSQVYGGDNNTYNARLSASVLEVV